MTTGAPPTWTRTPFPGKIPEAPENAKYIFSLMPQPTFPNVSPSIANQWFGVLPRATMDYSQPHRTQTPGFL
jgi:hypothetical protein